MMKKKGLAVIFVLCILFIGCRQDVTTDNSENVNSEEIAEQEEHSFTVSVATGDSEPETQSSENSENVEISDVESEPVKYGELNEENLGAVLYQFLSIKNDEELYKLDYLPLTDEFRENCYNDFTYLEEANYYKEMDRYIDWAVKDDIVACFFFIETTASDNYMYYAKLTMSGEQISGVELNRLTVWSDDRSIKRGIGAITEEQIATLDLVSDKAETYEMNYILYEMGYSDDWKVPNYWQDSYDEFDAPMGIYTPEAMQQYTEDNIRVEIEYFYDYGNSESVEDERTYLVQVIQMYKDEEQVAFCWNVWGWSGSAIPFDESRMGECVSYSCSTTGRNTLIAGDRVEYIFDRVTYGTDL